MSDAAVAVNTAVGGPPIRVRQRVIAGTTYDEQVVIQNDFDVETGLYVAHVGSFTVPASAHASTAGYFWLVNTSTATMVRLRKIKMIALPTAASAFISSPRITVERITFTGTPSGASPAPTLRTRITQNGYTADGTNVGTIRTASTGLTITAGTQAHSFRVGPTVTAVGYATPYEQWYNPEDKETLYLANGEGVVVRQPDAGTTSDTRSVSFDIAWEEPTLP